jgi:SAM-dependent methyltransferase
MTTREPRGVFGEVAEDYDRVRPGYPDQLVDDVLAAAGPGPVLEVGAGTGKATVAFAARGADLTCIEPDPRMAALLRRKLPSLPILVTTFEEWLPDRPFGLLFSAQAWHWVDPAKAPDLAFRALAPGGLFAPFWNAFLVTDPSLHAGLREVDDRHGLEADTPHRYQSAGFPGLRPFDEEWTQLHLDATNFPERDQRRYHSARSFSAADYATYLYSLSMYRMLEPAAARAAVDETTAVINRHAGVVDFDVITDVALARRAVA